MKWSSIKNLMLGFLVVMNIFVISAAAVRRYKSEKIPPLVLAASAEAMENSGVSCDESLLPDKYLSMERIKGEFFSAAELSKMFFSEQLAFQTDERTLIANKDGAQLLVEELGFAYYSEAKTVESSEKELRSALKKMGFDMRYAQYGGEGEFYCSYKGKTVFDMYIRASLGEDGSLARVEACWPKLTSAGSFQTGLSIIGSITAIGEAFSGGEIKEIEAGYSLVQNDSSSSAVFRCAWRVTLKDGRSKIFLN